MVRLCGSLAGMNTTSSCAPFHAPDTPAVLLEIAQAVSSTLDLKELLKIIAQRTAAACGADICSIFLWSPSGDQLVPMMSQTASGEQMDELWEEFKQMGSQKAEQIPAIIATIEQRGPVVLDDPATSGLLPARWIEAFRLKALLSVPLIRHDRVIGVLVLHQMVEGKPFTDAQVRLASAIASQAAMAIDNASAYHEIEELNISLEEKIAKRTREMLEMNRALEASHRKLQELDRVKSDFLMNVSHELRTPLTAITGSVDNMLEEITGPLSEPQRRYLLRVKANADQLVRLINDLLDLARIEEGRVQITPTFFSVTGLAGELVDALRPMAAEKALQLQLAETEDPLIVYADRDKVTQVLMNLIGNAIKFTPDGGQITVSVRQVQSAEGEVRGTAERTSEFAPHASHNNEQVEIAVTDTGEGIPAEEQPHIFDKFYQVQLGIQAKAKGTGLGLSIAKSLVELQRGHIWATSETGRGSTFAFTLPKWPLVERCNATAPSDAEKIS